MTGKDVKLVKVTIVLETSDGQKTTVAIDDLDPGYEILFTKGTRPAAVQPDPSYLNYEHDGRGTVSVSVAGRWNPS